MKKKKWKDVRSALVMVLVMVAMLSTATYAWFTLTSSPTVTGLQMTAATSGGLKISETGNGNWVDAIDITSTQSIDGNKMLSPVSVKDSNTDGVFEALFYEPVYLGNKVTGLKDTALNADNNEDKLSGYVARYTYWLKSDADSVKVGIMTAAPSNQTGTMGVDNNDQANLPGSFVRAKDTTDTNSAVNAVRVGIVADGVMYIYEPNFENDANTGTEAENGIAQNLWPVSDVISLSADGTITTGKGIDDYTSEALFEVTSAGEQIIMYIWLEGTDDDCVDQIQADNIEAQIQFTIVEEEAADTTPTP